MRRLALVSLVVSLSACSEPGATPPIDAAVPMDDAYAEDAFVPPVDVGPDAWIPTDAGAIRTTPTFPTAAGTCPDMTTSGTVMVHPSGIAARSAQIWVSSAAATMDGPLVLVWHGAGGSPSEAPYILGTTQLNAILAAGGIVIAPSHDLTNTQLPWFLDTGSREDDLFVADELVACARAAVGFDEMHVHSVGFSAGALHTAQMSFRRASYLASVVTYSGGLFNGLAPPPRDAMDARFAAMILYGGPDDVVLVSFDRASHQYLQALQVAGDFGFVCNHGMGHTVPPAAQPSAWQFLQDHPYGMTPHAYADGLPSGFYAACALP